MPKGGGDSELAKAAEALIVKGKEQGVLSQELRPAPHQVAADPCRVHPSHRSRPQAGAEGVPHARDESLARPIAAAGHRTDANALDVRLHP